MRRRTLTRREAIELIAEAERSAKPRDALLLLRSRWGAKEEQVSSDCASIEELGEWLTEYVDGCCVDDDVRSYGPQDADDTGLTASA